MTVIASDAETLQRTLEGRTIVAYEAVEMAFWEHGPDGVPVYGHVEVPCVQCLSVTLVLEDGEQLHVDTNLDGVEWGLLLVRELPGGGRQSEGENDPHSIYRRANLDRFPVGRVTRVTSFPSDRGQIRAIVLEFGVDAAAFVAGEFEEQFDGSLRLVLDDESVLFFPSGDGLSWAEAQVAKGPISPDATATLASDRQ